MQTPIKHYLKDAVIKKLLYFCILLLALTCQYGLLSFPLYVFDCPKKDLVKNKWFLASLKDPCEVIFASSTTKKRLNCKDEESKKVEFILQALEENWGNAFVYCDLNIHFFNAFTQVLQEARKIRFHTSKNIPENLDLLFLPGSQKKTINPGFFICDANERTKSLWQSIKDDLEYNPDLTLSKAITKKLFKVKKNFSKPIIFWDFLSMSFYTSTSLREIVSGTNVPSDLILHYVSNAHDPIDCNERMKTLADIVQLQNQYCSKQLERAASLATKDKCILLTMLYNETRPERIQEYIYCLEKNLCHPFIGKVHVLYDTSNDDKTAVLPILDYLIKHNVPYINVNGRQTYQEFFNLSNTLYPDAKIIIANADIYFDQTLALLQGYNLSNTFLALSRWEGCIHGPMAAMNVHDARRSQDAWIFQTPLKQIAHADIPLGTVRCDNKIAYYASKAGLKVINPSLSIRAIHMHQSNIRNYDAKGTSQSPDTLGVPATTLP